MAINVWLSGDCGVIGSSAQFWLLFDDHSSGNVKVSEVMA
jgi:hypothetical protein